MGASRDRQTSISPQAQRKVALARRYAQQRRFDAAEKLCRQLVDSGVEDPYVLSLLATRARDRGDHDAAIDLWRRLCEARPEDPKGWALLAEAASEAGKSDVAIEAWRRALRLDPDNGEAFARLALALAAAGETERAARAMTRAFVLDEELAYARRNPRAPTERREISQAGDDLLQSFHFEANQAAAESSAEAAGETLPERWSTFLQRFHGKLPREYADSRQQPDYMYYEGITARPFWPREEFPWLAEIEAQADRIREEFLAVMNAGQESFEPYVQASARAPEAWQAMSGKLTWASFHLIRGNRPVRANCDRCPVTYEVLSRLPLVRVDGHAPEAFFSVLEPGTHIPPHYGVSNAKLAIHLPLIIPPDCAIRVGGETRGWEEGRCLVFDDSFLHEAWNRSDRTRVVLIFETWNPDLSELERGCLKAIIERGDAWYRANQEIGVEDLF